MEGRRNAIPGMAGRESGFRRYSHLAGACRHPSRIHATSMRHGGGLNVFRFYSAGLAVDHCRRRMGGCNRQRGAVDRSTGPYGGAVSLGAVMAMAPGFGLIFSGLLLLAIGPVIWRMARIDRNTADTVDLLERLMPKKSPG